MKIDECKTAHQTKQNARSKNPTTDDMKILVCENNVANAVRKFSEMIKFCERCRDLYAQIAPINVHIAITI